MHVLLLTNYFPPDLSAGSFRMKSLVGALAPNHSVTVVCMAPNRYDSHAPKAAAIEEDGCLTIHRIPAHSHGGSVRAQAANFFRFAASAFLISRRTECDVVVATSSRLFTAVLGAVISVSKQRPYVLDIRDIFVDTIQDVFRKWWMRPLLPLFSLLERFAITRARRVNLVSPGFMSYFGPRYPKRHFELITNGVDPEFVESWGELVTGPSAAGGPLTIVYAGNIGEGQGLEKVLPLAAKRCENEARFIVLGDGGRRAALAEELARLKVRNVELRPPVPREELLRQYATADALLIHLNDYAAFHKVLPSKLFECGATGLPILAGVSGVAAEFVRDELPDARIFPPCDSEALAREVAILAAARSSARAERAGFIARHLRPVLSERLAAMIVEGARSGKRVAEPLPSGISAGTPSDRQAEGLE